MVICSQLIWYIIYVRNTKTKTKTKTKKENEYEVNQQE